MDLVLFSTYIRLDQIDITLFRINKFSLFIFSWYEDWSEEPDAYGLNIQFLGIDIYNYSNHYKSYIDNYYGNRDTTSTEEEKT